MSIEVIVKGRPFSNSTVGNVRCLVDEEGFVRVWDHIAGHYTVCHSLGETAKRNARKAAVQKRAEVSQ